MTSTAAVLGLAVILLTISASTQNDSTVLLTMSPEVQTTTPAILYSLSLVANTSADSLASPTSTSESTSMSTTTSATAATTTFTDSVTTSETATATPGTTSTTASVTPVTTSETAPATPSTTSITASVTPVTTSETATATPGITSTTVSVTPVTTSATVPATPSTTSATASAAPDATSTSPVTTLASPAASTTASSTAVKFSMETLPVAVDVSTTAYLSSQPTVPLSIIQSTAPTPAVSSNSTQSTPTSALPSNSTQLTLTPTVPSNSTQPSATPMTSVTQIGSATTTVFISALPTTAGVTKTVTASSDAPTTRQAVTTPNTDLLLPIVIPVVVCGAIIILTAVGVSVYCKRRRIPHTRPVIPALPTPSPPELAKLSKPVNLADFSEYFKEMSSDSCLSFAEEYSLDLKDVGRDQPCTVALLAANREKNRFTNILPYDHSRVRLRNNEDREATDYINANYMPGRNGKSEFIATQGPLKSTTNDFWQMVWEQECKAIIMLTRCVEGAQDKCFHYWPNGHDPVTYGNITVHVVDELEQPHWTVTDFRVSRGGGDGSERSEPAMTRHLRHFHYTSFPDHRAPLDVQSMLQFTRLVRLKLTRSPGGPIVVHCSAGVGRSGTFIAVDHLLQLIEDGCTNVDVYGIVREMRIHRMYMVQTEDQYVFIHKLVELELQKRRVNESQKEGCENIAFLED